MDRERSEEEAAAGRTSLEKPAVVSFETPDGSAHALDALYRPGRAPETGGMVIAPPHPLYGGSMASPVVTQLALAAARGGLASLRFDWRGVGGSTGAASGRTEDHDADYAAALAHLAETVPGELCAAGYSAGAAAAARAARAEPRVTRLVLVAPPPAMLEADVVRGFAGPVLVVVGGEDGLAPAAVLREWVAANPVARVEELPDVDHFFLRGLGELDRAVRRWLGAA